MSKQPIAAYTLTMAATVIARGYVAAQVHEVGGNNEGPQVGTFQRAGGGNKKDSWCKEYQDTCDLKALANLLPKPYTPETFVAVCESLHATLELYRAVTPSCGEAMRDAQKRGIWIDRKDITVIKEGWLLLYAWNAQAVGKRVPAHVGRANADWKRSTLLIPSLEGNTAPDGGNQSDGDGCYAKSRSFANVVGVIRTY